MTVLDASATTVSGRVLHAEDDRPFVGARLRLGGQETYTDETGYYRFLNPPVLGDQVILIDGHTANTVALRYPSAIAMPVMIQAGRDNLALTSYLQAVDAAKAVTIVPGQGTSVMMADLPNYSLNIPQGAILYGWDGTPITQINVRTVAVDRLPIKPVPEGVNVKTVYLYYFFREGGANPTQPIPVTMANDMGALPGEKADLWYYDESTTPDPNSNQWRIMGQGTVSDDGLSIVSDPGVGIPKFCCGAGFASPAPPPEPPGSCPDPGPKTENPVIYGTGVATVMEDHSLGLNGLVPTRLGCSYNSRTDRIGPFGRGTVLSTEWELAPSGGALVLMSPAGHRWVLSKGSDGIYRTAPGRTGAEGVEATATTDTALVRFPEGTQYEFAKYARRGNWGLKRQTDPHGNQTLMARSGGSTPGLLQSVTDPNGRVFQITYSGSQISRITDPLGRTLDFAYDGNARLSQVTDPTGNTTRYEWDAANRIAAKTNARGLRTSYTYDGNGRALTETFADGSGYRFDYQVTGGRVMQTTVTDPRSNRELWRFNGLGDWTRREDPLGRISTRSLDASRNLVLAQTDPLGRTTRYTYDAKGNRTSVKDPQGNVTLYDYDPFFNKPTQITDPLGNVTQHAYDGQGNLIATTTPENETTRFTYTPQGQVFIVIDSQGNLTLYDYDPVFNKPTRITDPLGNVTQHAYDGQGNLIATTTPENETTRFTYTPQGQVETVTDPLGRVTRLNYDPQGNLIRTTDPLGNTTDLAYDAANRLAQITSPSGLTARRAYDVLDRLTETTDPSGNVTRITYDPQDRLLSLTDPLGHAVETNTWDARGRLAQRTDAQGQRSAWTYDGNGNPLTATDRQGRITRYAHDAANRLTEVTDPDGRSTRYDYDLADNLARLSDNRSGDLLFSYDEQDRLTRIASDQGTVEYHYDVLGRRTQRLINGGDPTDTQYDRAGRITQITYRGKTVSYQYDPAGRLIKKTLPNGITQQYAWDNGDRLTQLRIAKADGSPIETLDYQYDPDGKRIQKNSGATSVSETPMAATYDAANRLTQLTINPGPNAKTYTLSYDPQGNLTQKQNSNDPQDSTTYTWDARGRLTQLQSPTHQASFQYDPLGRRISKTVNGSTVQYLYDGAQAIAEIRNNAVDATYHTGIALDEVLARYAASGNKTLVMDALGSVIAQTDESQSPSNWYAYSPYGETQSIGPDNGNPLQYTGRENDGTGVYYYRARYYDPVGTQWLSDDPIGLAGGLNQRAYVSGDPISLSDALGLDPANGRGFSTHYGNWCGRNWSGGKSGPIISSTPDGPVDSLDACCMAHDYCFAEVEDESCPLSKRKKKEALEQCNATLARCSRALSNNGRGWPSPPSNTNDAYFYKQKLQSVFK
ncbi:RHS repeat-associated core domain-containing protein [Denitratisoma oestradiolicum]|uniref:RHS repeat-associated core domain-containing protein n=1 Tax=Denitratisoma oestradiolicum TaxID=311182 RepID=UPI001B86FBA0|nr:RHS repeat-associated core domain-containing protein [Denitratisoma oestradiolicum]